MEKIKLMNDVEVIKVQKSFKNATKRFTILCYGLATHLSAGVWPKKSQNATRH